MSKITAKSTKKTHAQSSASTVASDSTTATPESCGQCLDIEGIRVAAYLNWEAAGKPDGDGTRFWLEAEQAAHSPLGATHH